jgi:chromate reductase
MQSPRIALIVGSFRPASRNRKLGRAIAKLGKERFAFHDSRIDDLPHFNQDIEQTPPDVVKRLKAEVEAADAVLFITPEYNRSIPGILKNAFDWGSRPFGKSVWTRKPAATAGATAGKIGTALAQQHLRNLLLGQDMIVMGQPEFYLTMTDTSIDANDDCDESTAKFIGNFLDKFAAWIEQTRKR